MRGTPLPFSSLAAAAALWAAQPCAEAAPDGSQPLAPIAAPAEDDTAAGAPTSAVSAAGATTGDTSPGRPPAGAAPYRAFQTEDSPSHSEEYPATHSAEHSEEHSGTHSAEHSEEHSTTHSAEHSEEHATTHSAEHSGHHLGEHPHQHHRFHFGGSAVALSSFTGSDIQPSFGGEAFFEVIVEPEWLEIELNIGGMAAEAGFLLAVDLVYKKPFHVTSWLHPFVGLGPTFVPAFLPTEYGYAVGGTLVAGAHFWFTASFGFVLEAKYNLLYQRRDLQSGIAQELGGGAGFVVAM